MIGNRRLLAAALIAACVGCGGGGDPLGPTANVNEAMLIRRALGGSEEGAGGTAAADVGTGWATLKGRFIFEGTPPPPQPKQGPLSHKDAAVCAPGGVPPNERDLVVGDGGGLQYVALYVRNAPRVHESAQAVPADPTIFDQKQCTFTSHVFACQVGQTVILKNSDPVGHNTKIEGRSSTNDLIPASSSLEHVFNFEEAVPQGVSCSIHPWMHAYALARKDGYYAVTGPDGSFEIANLPAGVELELQVWHERGTGRGGGLALDTQEAQALKWNNSGRFRVTLEEDEVREIVINVPPSAVGA